MQTLYIFYYISDPCEVNLYHINSDFKFVYDDSTERNIVSMQASSKSSKISVKNCLVSVCVDSEIQSNGVTPTAN